MDILELGTFVLKQGHFCEVKELVEYEDIWAKWGILSGLHFFKTLFEDSAFVLGLWLDQVYAQGLGQSYTTECLQKGIKRYKCVYESWIWRNKLEYLPLVMYQPQTQNSFHWKTWNDLLSPRRVMRF